MNINIIFGHLIATAIIAAISALLLKISARLIIQKSADFGVAFTISFMSFLAAFVAQDLFPVRMSQSSFTDILPGIIFFVSCWLLNGQFVKYGEEKASISYSKAFLVTILQCVALFITFLILGFVLIGIFFSIK